MRNIILFVSSLLCTACSSWDLKQRCEETNWFDHSKKTAMAGVYLEEDPFIRQCKKVDRANGTQLDLGFKAGRESYCTYENIQRLGETGERANYQMCDNLTIKQMQERHLQGLTLFCTPDSGYLYGVSGKVYKNVCFKISEPFFLPSYQRGRREYLEKAIVSRESDVQSGALMQAQLDSQISKLSSEITALPQVLECHSESVYNSGTKEYESQRVCSEPWYIRSRRSELYREMDGLRERYSRQAKDLQDWRSILADAKDQLARLPPPETPKKLTGSHP